MHLTPRSGTPPKKLASVLHPSAVPAKKYLPDPDGYFVCVANKLITNKALCLRYRAATKNDISYNKVCSGCPIDLNRVPSMPLSLFDELSRELQALLYSSPGSTSRVKVSS